MFDSDTEQARTDRVFKLTNSRYDTTNFDSRVKRIAPKYESYRTWNGGDDLNFFGENGGNDDSGVCSPPMGKFSPTRSPNYQNLQNSYGSLSPAQKSHLVAKGQRELMEMIRSMPESSYELSLKDMVEHPTSMEQQLIEKRHENKPSLEREIGVPDFGLIYNSGNEEEKKKLHNNNYNYNKRQIKRYYGGFNNGGFLLKMVFPISWGSRNKKSETNNTLSKVSPRPSMDGSVKISVDKEWWKKKKLSDYGDIESGGIRNNSGSSGSSSSTATTRSSSRHGRSCNPGCWSFFRTNNGKSIN